MTEHEPALPHGALVEVLPTLHFVQGTTRPTFMGQRWQFSRNMVVVREGAVLTLVNTVRLDEAGLKTLEALGDVTHVVKLGSFHGKDDAFYLDRYGARLWAMPGMTHESGRRTDEELAAGAMPFTGASLFSFETAALPEGLLVLEREGGVVISCDSLQNWSAADAFFDEDSALRMAELGFLRRANVGPGWRLGSGVRADDFERLRRVPFAHLLPAHGEPLLGDAAGSFAATFAEQFGVG